MKRGLVVLDHAELPEAEWRRRLATVRERLRGEGVDVALVYGDVFRSDDIGYLTNLCLYWNETVLAVPVDGEPALLTKLSPRVHSWMRRTSTLTDLRSGTAFGSLVTALLAERQPGTVGLVDAQLWPTPLLDEVVEATSGWTVSRLGGLVRELRSSPSEPELALLRTAGSELGKAVAGAATCSARDRVSIAELSVRGAGFTDVVVRANESSVDITGQHRNNWVRIAREFEGPLTAALSEVVSAARPGVGVAELGAAAQARLAGLDAACDVRIVDHADLSTNGEYAGAPGVLRAGQVVVLAVEAVTPDGEATAAADTVLVTDSGVENLTSVEVAA